MGWPSKEAENEYRRNYYLRNRDRILQRVKAYQKANPDKINAKNAEYRAKYPDREAMYYKNWKARNPGLKAIQSSEWKRKNPDKTNEATARRRAAKKNATPQWRNTFFLREAYALAKLRTKMTGITWEVDHIVPLQSDLVCGLHVEHNIQVISKEMNKVKSNKYWQHMPEEVCHVN